MQKKVIALRNCSEISSSLGRRTPSSGWDTSDSILPSYPPPKNFKVVSRKSSLDTTLAMVNPDLFIGDKIYGLKARRKGVLESLKSTVNCPVSQRDAFTIDEYVDGINQRSWLQLQLFIAFLQKENIKLPETLTDLTIFRRHACKKGIDFTISHQGKIHFILDLIDQGHVVDKHSIYGKFYTDCELRYIYRNWERFKNSIRFYKIENGELRECPAPWDADPNLWEQYTPKVKDGVLAPHAFANIEGGDSASIHRTLIRAEIIDTQGKFLISPEETDAIGLKELLDLFPNLTSGQLFRIRKILLKAAEQV